MIPAMSRPTTVKVPPTAPLLLQNLNIIATGMVGMRGKLVTACRLGRNSTDPELVASRRESEDEGNGVA
jgi:hypothetical protein